jgi:hypothetical protein
MDKLCVHQIFIISLGMKKACVKKVPKNLTNVQQLGWEQVSIHFLDKIQAAPKPSQQHNIIVLWNSDDPENKRQRTLREFTVFHRLKKAQVSKSKFKNMTTVSFLTKEKLSSPICSSRTNCQPRALNWSSTAFSLKSEAKKTQHMARQVDVASIQYISSCYSTSKANSQEKILPMDHLPILLTWLSVTSIPKYKTFPERDTFLVQRSSNIHQAC